ncbi:MAG: UDP-N-acetylmuramate dehydrogenase [Anaerolineae bacterium]
MGRRMLELGIAVLTTHVLDELEAAAAAEGLGGRTRRAEPLSRHTSLRVGGPADLFVKAETIHDVAGWVGLARRRSLPVVVLGNGSNVLVSDRGIRGVVVEMACTKFEARETESLLSTEPAGVVTAEAGVSLPALIYQMAKQGWGGFEQGIGVPGTVGACVVNNAGAHGWSMADSVLSVLVLGPQGDTYDLPGEALGFEYRGSRFKHQPPLEREIVLEADLALHHADPAALQQRMAEYTAQRRRSQPTEPSVGSMFKNPPGDYAGRLIDAAGLKGRRLGQAQISPKHANFFVNLGGATAADITGLIHLARSAVREQFGVSLELEIEPLGDWGEDDV